MGVFVDSNDMQEAICSWLRVSLNSISI
ncbi:uncharacterized protein METZ01_LOCUS487797 [marine metagenome]|uniref:Uncharacterized protein n=1 Tax=marine metagenome TaxID=408172 RepID=A0A383CSC2_9ZZZZ